MQLSPTILADGNPALFAESSMEGVGFEILGMSFCFVAKNVFAAPEQRALPTGKAQLHSPPRNVALSIHGARPERP